MIRARRTGCCRLAETIAIALLVLLVDQVSSKWVVPACSEGHLTATLPFCNADLPRDARTFRNYEGARSTLSSLLEIH
jgi:hypothetical protein